MENFQLAHINSIAQNLTTTIDSLAKQYLHHQNDPTKEMVLAHAFRAFLPIASHKELDLALSILTMQKMFSTAASAKDHNQNINESNTIQNSPHIHEDGIYLIDQQCISNANSNQRNLPIMLILIFLLMFKKN